MQPIKSENSNFLELGSNIDPVTKKEKWAFYVFGFATEPYYATAMAVAVPLLLETMSANAGFEKDLVTPCDTSKDYSCKVHFGTWMDTTSFTLYTTAISVAIQALVFVSLSAVADYGNLRKPFLFGSAIICAVFCILFLTIVDNQYYWVAALFTIISNVSYGASCVFYYAYVPTLTQNSPEVLESQVTLQDSLSIRERVANDISGKGFAFGYFGAVINLAIAAIIMFFTNGIGPVSTYPLQIACAFAGAWMLVFMILSSKWLVNRPGPPLPPGENSLLFSWKSVFHTFSHTKELSQAFLFLLSWFIMSDAVSTIVSVAIIFSKKKLNFTLFELIIAALIVPVAAGVGCLVWNKIQSRFHLTTKTMILIVTSLYCVLPIYGLIGLNSTVTFGLKTKAEIYIFSVYHGFLLGAIQSFYRVMFSEMLPPGKENEFFGLYEITDKGSSWIGPLVIGAISDLTDEIRYGFFFLIGSMLVSLAITYMVNPIKGKQQAQAFDELKPPALSKDKSHISMTDL